MVYRLKIYTTITTAYFLGHDEGFVSEALETSVSKIPSPTPSPVSRLVCAVEVSPVLIKLFHVSYLLEYVTHND